MVEHPLQLVDEEHQGDDGRRVGGLVLAAVVDGAGTGRARPVPSGRYLAAAPPARSRPVRAAPATAPRRTRSTSGGRSSRRRSRPDRRAGLPRPTWRRPRPGPPGSAPAGRTISAITPVDVSLWINAYRSMPSRPTASARRPTGASMTSGSSRWGAADAAAANLDENSPKTRCWLRRPIRQNVATSQKAMAPPLPSTTS